jgi:hypothetical protein
LHSIALNNGTSEYLNGDHIQSIERWIPPKPFENVETDAIHACLDQIKVGMENGERYGSSKRGGSKRYVGLLVEQMLSVPPEQANKIVKS